MLVDPDFVDPISVIYRVPTVNSFGENTTVETPFATNGSVQPASGRDVQRLPDALRVGNICMFWYRGEIDTNETGTYPSILTFKGKRYQVLNVGDWLNYGAGFTTGLCVQEDLS